MAPIRIAAIGLGWVTTNRHIPALRHCDQARLVGLIDHQPDRAETIARKMGLPFSATATRVADVPWLDQFDAVTIGTPPQSHYDVARSYLEAGKHVLVEKPMAMTVGEAEHLSKLAAELHLVVAVVHNFLFSRSVRRVTRMIAEGRLGEIRSIWAVQLSNPKRRLPAWHKELPLGLFYDESPHSFSLIRHLAGCEPKFRSINVFRTADESSTPSRIAAFLDADGISIRVDMDFQAPLSEWHIGVLGTRGAAFVDVFRDILVIAPNDGSHLGRDILRSSVTVGWGHLVGTLKSGLLVMAGRLMYGNDEVVHQFCLACHGEPGALVGISAADGVAVVAMQHRVIADDK